MKHHKIPDEIIMNLPVPLLATMVGAATLSNIWLICGYTWLRHITMFAATIILLAYTMKLLRYFPICKKEYAQTVPCSLYGGFMMLAMILGSYYFEWSATFGKILWLAGLIGHALHILVFTFGKVLRGVNPATFVPSWYVTYNGIMVSAVVGKAMEELLMMKLVLYYGIAVFLLILPFMLRRLTKVPIGDDVFHTQAILLAPSSLCVVTYLNIVEMPSLPVAVFLYTLVLVTLLFVLLKLPAFFSYSFTPAFAGLTFPMAIGTMASSKMAGFLTDGGYKTLGMAVKELSGIQLYITTAIIAFVMFNFLKMFAGSFKMQAKWHEHGGVDAKDFPDYSGQILP